MDERIERRTVLAGAAGLVGAATVGQAGAATRPAAVAATPPVGGMELAVAARCPTSPTGMTVSARGRIFVFMPRFDDKTVYSVGEVAPDGAVTPIPMPRSTAPIRCARRTRCSTSPTVSSTGGTGCGCSMPG